MIPELGQIALLLALATSVVLGVLPLWGAARGQGPWMALARPAAYVHLALIAVAYALLTVSFVQLDFSVAYVAENTNRQLPLVYRVVGVWGGHEGSLLLWQLIQAAWMAALARFSRSLPLPLVARSLAVLGWIATGFALFVLITSNPFTRLSPVPLDGHDLNPLLQDPGMVVHPPLLYMGYVGFAVAFALALGALLGGRLDAAWARWMRPWTTVAWLFLTLGISVGSLWAYQVLGWGGWWFWDPVENASFLPWLAGTALIHSLAVTDKRGAFRAWTVLLALLTFSLSLLGTFLVRSGVLSSVHAFATDPQRGLALLLFLAVVVGVALAVYAWRAPTLGLGGRFAPVSRETVLLLNNVLLVVAVASVGLGTLYPLVLDALTGAKISVGPPYFELVFVPLMLPLVFLVGLGPLARWKETELPALARRLRWAAGLSVASAVGMAWWAGQLSFGAVLGLWMGAWILCTIATDMGGHGRRLGQAPRALWGMWLAHAGVAVFAVGVTMVGSYELERDAELSAGQQAELGPYTFHFRGVREVLGPNYRAVQAWVEVTRDGEPLAQLYPEKRLYASQDTSFTEPAVVHGPLRDFYVSLGEVKADRATWTLRLHVKPFVSWIWAGTLLMALGGGLAASDRRYHVAQRQAAASAVQEPA